MSKVTRLSVVNLILILQSVFVHNKNLLYSIICTYALNVAIPFSTFCGVYHITRIFGSLANRVTIAKFNLDYNHGFLSIEYS